MKMNPAVGMPFPSLTQHSFLSRLSWPWGRGMLEREGWVHKTIVHLFLCPKKIYFHLVSGFSGDTTPNLIDCLQNQFSADLNIYHSASKFCNLVLTLRICRFRHKNLSLAPKPEHVWALLLPKWLFFPRSSLRRCKSQGWKKVVKSGEEGGKRRVWLEKACA